MHIMVNFIISKISRGYLNRREHPYRQTTPESNASEMSCPIGLLLLFPKVISKRNGTKSPHHWRVQVYFHKQNIHCIKNDPVDDKIRQLLEDTIKKWQKSLRQQGTEFIYERSSCLPVQMSEEWVYGRSNEIALVKDNIYIYNHS